MKRELRMLSILLIPVFGLKAQEKYPEAISDNSFLLEEAYNQEANVVQHISNLMYSRQSKNTEYVLAQEWPVIFAKDQLRHQLSYSVPFQWIHGGASGVGDIAINYRYQLMSDDDQFWIAPRFSVILPSGDDKKSLGSGHATYEVALPVSKRLADQWAGHFNMGMGITPGVKSGAKKEMLKSFDVGASLIWLARKDLNVFVEYLGSFEDGVVGGSVKSEATHMINPGICYAKNFGALQVVPGLSMPMQLNGSSKEKQIFVYLSLEHPFR